MRRFALICLLLIAGVATYLFIVPAPIQAVAWNPPPLQNLDGPYALNDHLASVEKLLPSVPGPEAIAVDPQGKLVTGLLDGRIIRFDTEGRNVQELVNTGGRPLGLRYHSDGRLFICDAEKGLLMMEKEGRLQTLVSRQSNVPVWLADDLALASDGTVYFTDASARHPLPEFTRDLLEHSATGRLLRYVPKTQTVEVVASDLCFANGVAFGPDEQWLVVTETGGYRLWKIWVAGPKAGTKEIFATVPGFPDNLTYSKTRRTFWVAIGSPRNRLIDALAPHPFWRETISRLPKFVQPAPERHAFVVEMDEQGRVLQTLQHKSPTSYSPIASVLEHDGALYFGSFLHRGIGKFQLAATVQSKINAASHSR